jgi:NAD(P)H-hydrate epimerase
LIPVLGSAQARAFDRFMSERCAVPSLLLMENAGRAAALSVHTWLESAAAARLAARSARRRVLCLCGTGNNGGDGLVVARHLATLGHEVRVLACGPAASLTPDARVSFDAWRGLGGAVLDLPAGGEVQALLVEIWSGVDVVVDGLLGTGLSRDLSGPFRALVESLNAAELPVFALDVPSGLNADTGVVMGAAVRARVTITFGHPKAGLLTSVASAYTGEIELADLGVPRDRGPALEPRAHWIEASDVRSWLPARGRSAHKGSAGRVLIVAGSVGKTGAALLSSSAALRAGAGLVTICTFADAAASLDQRVLEVMTQRIDPDQVRASLDHALEGVDVVVIGPGLGLSPAAREVVDHVVLSSGVTKVMDADAITHFAGRAGELVHARGHCLLTPHPGELGRLLGLSAAAVEADRFTAIERAVELTGQTLLLKGPHTLVAERGAAPWLTSTGHPVLASAGSGDVLSGICGALAVELPLQRAGAGAAYLHGLAARLWVTAQGGADRGLLAHELLEYLPRARAELVASGLAL